MNINIKIIEKHDNILNIIRSQIPCLVNFDWHGDYPRYSEEVIDVDHIFLNVNPAWYEHNWVTILASHGLVKEFTWIFPHDEDKEDIKVFESRSGDSIIFNKRFDPSMEIACQYVTIDMDFFGSRIPINWSPREGRTKLLNDVLNTLKADDITLIICKSNNFVNYDIDKFLQEMLTNILCKQNNQ